MFVLESKRKTETDADSERIRKKDFDISDLNLNNNGNYYVNINNSLWEANYQSKDISTIIQEKEIIIEERKVVNFSKGECLLLGLAPLVAPVIVGGVGLAIDEEALVGGLLLGLISGVGGSVAGIITKYAYPAIETRKVPTGKVTERIPVFVRTERNVLNEGWVYQNQAAENVNLKVSLAGRGYSTKTDENGELNLSNFLGEDFFFPNQIPTRSQLEKIVRNTPLIRQIKPSALDVLLNDFIESSKKQDFSLTIATDEKSTEEEQVKNASRNFIMSSYGISNDSIYRIVGEFVDKEINSNIKSLIFDVKDITTRVPINGVNFDINSDAPSKEELAGKYFIGILRDYAKRQIGDYLSEKELYENCPSRTTFYAYVPSRISLEISHPDYKFVLGEVVMSKDERKIVYMLDKGQKIRVEEETERGGRIE